MSATIIDRTNLPFATARSWRMFVLLAALWVQGCATGAQQNDAKALPVAGDAGMAQVETIVADMAEIETIDQAAAQGGRVVAVVGVYTPMNLNRRADSPPLYGDRIQLLLRDGQSVMLEAGDRGIRDAVEIERFTGRRVRAEGVFESDCLAWGDGTIASIVGPCLRNISRLENHD
jgi:hypothetical protein